MPRLKVNYHMQRTSKETMKMIIRHFKENILPVQNESGGIIFKKELFLSYQELKTSKIETSEHS